MLRLYVQMCLFGYRMNMWMCFKGDLVLQWPWIPAVLSIFKYVPWLLLHAEVWVFKTRTTYLHVREVVKHEGWKLFAWFKELFSVLMFWFCVGVQIWKSKSGVLKTNKSPAKYPETWMSSQEMKPSHTHPPFHDSNFTSWVTSCDVTDVLPGGSSKQPLFSEPLTDRGPEGKHSVRLPLGLWVIKITELPVRCVGRFQQVDSRETTTWRCVSSLCVPRVKLPRLVFVSVWCFCFVRTKLYHTYLFRNLFF